jgi:large subunit ribosomal protein L23
MSDMTLKPHVSEKAYGSSKDRVYVFLVPKRANKVTVAAAVAKQFEVEVVNIRTAVLTGKRKRSIRRGGRPVFGRRSDRKKAYVTIAEGQSIPLFAAEEEAEEKAEAQK